MKGTRYETKIDLELYRQMVDMIYRLSSKADKIDTKQQIETNSLFWEMPAEVMEKTYGLHYPGEVLERLGEKTELTTAKIRALSLALGQTKAIHEEGMFIGTQFSRFYQRTFHNLGHTDCYLLAAKYLLEEKDKRSVYDEFLKYPWEKIEEILFALSVFPEDDLVWERSKAYLNHCLGKERILDVYVESELYMWICVHCAPRLRGYRKKDLDVLKYITRLPNEPARNGNNMQEKLADLGYTLPELYFLNGIFISEPGIGYEKNSITSERIAVEVCKFFLNEEKIYPESVYDLCGKLIDFYKEFNIKLEGTEGILPYLKNDIQLKNVKTFQLLFPYKEAIYGRYVQGEIFYIDLTDQRWDPLYTWLEKTEFDSLVTQTIDGRDYTDGELKQFLSRYKFLTGEKYEATFWNTEWDTIRGNTFSKLSEANILNPVALMETYVNQLEKNVEETEEKWKYMFAYLLNYMNGVESPQVFQMLNFYLEGIKRLGISDLTVKKLLFESFGIEEWRRGRDRFEKLKFLRIFLEPEKHDKLFQWLDSTVFRYMPEDYIHFLVAMLEDPDLFLWIPKEEAKEVCFRILPLVEGDSEQKKLRLRYMSKEDFIRQEQEEEERKRRIKLLEERKAFQKLKRKFTKFIAANAETGRFEPIHHFLDKERYPMRYKAKKDCGGVSIFSVRKELCYKSHTKGNGKTP